jgi:hypothetical protein
MILTKPYHTPDIASEKHRIYKKKGEVRGGKLNIDKKGETHED